MSRPALEHYDDRSSHHAPPQHHSATHSVRAGTSHRRQTAGYTLTHAGHQVRLGPVAFWIAVGTLVIMGAWTVTTGTYFAFRDDVLTRLIAREAKMQFAYEDRIAELRTQIDRITSRQMLDQEQYEQKLDGIMKRQSMLEARSSAMSSLPDMGVTGSIKPGRPEALAPAKPSPLNDSASPLAGRDRQSFFDARPFSGAQTAAASGGLNGTLTRLQISLDRIEARQAAALRVAQDKYDGKVKRMRNVLADLGLNPLKVPAPKVAGVGGPFVPLPRLSDSGAFERQLQHVSVTRAQADSLFRTLTSLPVRKPVTGELEKSSGFGVRTDPFLGRPAMHTGIDFRGDMGEPVHVTASGTVTSAGRSGGYGQMIEVDHGNGYATRYGHLSEIDVKVGQHVKIGDVIGKLGSTGRSTGPHLHYETRIEGEAVNPQKFLNAGDQLGNLM